MEHKLTAASGRGYVLCEAPKADPAVFKVADGLDEVVKRPAKAVPRS